MTDDSPPSILAKSFALLGSFSADRRVMSLSEIGRASGLPKSTVHRLLARLVELGVIEHHRSGYRIGMTMLQIAANSPAMSMREVAAPFLATLRHRTGMAVHLAVLRGFDIVVLESISRRTLASVPSTVGACMPAHCTALGKSLLAGEDLDDLRSFLPHPLPTMTSASISDTDRLIEELYDVRRSGIAREINEAQPKVACTARGLSVMGSVVGAISVAYPAHSSAGNEVESALRGTASRIVMEIQTALSEGRVHWFPNEIDATTSEHRSLEPPQLTVTRHSPLMSRVLAAPARRSGPTGYTDRENSNS